jgi:hypothetical protein
MAKLSTAGLAQSTLAHIAFAVLAMGGWAAFANRSHGAAAMALAGAVQGALSGAITFFLKRSLELMGARSPLAFAWLVPPLISCSVVLVILRGVHALAGTPEIWKTIAVPYAVSSLYAWIYAFSLYAARRRATA